MDQKTQEDAWLSDVVWEALFQSPWSWSHRQLEAAMWMLATDPGPLEELLMLETVSYLSGPSYVTFKCTSNELKRQ